MTIDKSDIDSTWQIVFGIEFLGSFPGHATVARQRESHHRTVEIVSRKKIASWGIVRLRPGIDPIPVGNHWSG
jgi:hypothetical protein